MAISYDYYRIFFHIAQCRSFTRAAELLNNNQPNISRCMNNLENELGCKLFVRSNRGVRLTPEGERLYKHVAIAYEQLRIGEEEVQRDCGLESGTISIGASEAALSLLLLENLLETLSSFHARYPGVRIRITNETTQEAVASLMNGETDCAIITTPAEFGKSLRTTPLLTFQSTIICGKQYEALASEPRSLCELSSCPFICPSRKSGSYRFYQHLFAMYHVPFRVDIETSTMDQVLPMIRRNLGIGFFPQSLLPAALDGNQLCEIHLKEPIPSRTIYLAEDPSHPQSMAMKSFLHLLFPKGAKNSGRSGSL